MSTSETRIEIPPKHNNKSRPEHSTVSTDQSILNCDVSHLLLKIYGCGMCDKMFEIEKEFSEHCCDHFCEDTGRDTFLELFEIHLRNYFP